MTLSAPFIFRPVATTLLSLGVVLAGMVAFFQLPVAPLPQVDFPTISIQASLPGASSETMAAMVATPLERSLGQIAGITEMTSSSSFGATRISLQFDLNRDIDGTARDVQAAINAASSLLPPDLPSRPTYRKGAAVRISDLGTAVDSVEDLRHAGLKGGKPSVLLILSKQPGANIIETVDRVKALVPQLQASIPNAIDLSVVRDRAGIISASLHEVELSLLMAVVLVILVVFVFLRNLRSALIPIVTVPMSLIGTFGIMHLCHYSLNNLSLMALTIATGFVVDDAIVVLENTSRYIEKGVPPREAALKGAGEVGFTVLSMSLSLIAVFFPILLIGGRSRAPVSRVRRYSFRGGDGFTTGFT